MDNASPTVWDFLLNAKHLVLLSFMVLGLVLLFLRRVNRWVRIGVLGGAFLLYGLDLVFPLHPSPVCATTKLFMFNETMGKIFPAFLALFLVMFVPSLFGRKLFCGWVCPLGAMQELINKVPFKWRWKQFNFTVFNGIRFTLLVLFFMTFYAVVRHVTYLGESVEADLTNEIWTAFLSYSVYEPINFFELLHWNIDRLWITMMAILVVASLILYRPFCYAICPVGALSWLLERVAPARVRVNAEKCNSCGVCAIKSPCPTIRPLFEGKRFNLPDCTSCGECLGTCPRDAIYFGVRSNA
ncbi:MAG: hypothetical protein Kow0074_22680 [Candidatus Zixiibacteriota bacterium]